MAVVSDDALVLDALPFRDRHQLVSILTRRHGVVRGVLRGARGGKAPRRAATEILSLVHCTYHQGAQAELATVRTIEIETSSYPLACDLDRVAAAAVVAELLLTFCPPSEPATVAFRLGRSLLHALLEGAPPRTVVAYAQLWVLWIAGLMPDMDAMTAAAAGLEPDDLSFLALCRRTPPEAILERPPAGLAAWLDRRSREEAERHLKALDFFVAHRGA
mgnify:CR=1 FL=1